MARLEDVRVHPKKIEDYIGIVGEKQIVEDNPTPLQIPLLGVGHSTPAR